VLQAVVLRHASPRLSGTGQWRLRSLLKWNERGRPPIEGLMKGWSGWESCTSIGNLFVEGAEVRVGLFGVVVLYLNFCLKHIQVFGNPPGYRETFIPAFHFRVWRDSALCNYLFSLYHTNIQTLKICQTLGTLRTPFRAIMSEHSLGALCFFLFFFHHCENNSTSRVRIHGQAIGKHDHDIFI